MDKSLKPVGRHEKVAEILKAEIRRHKAGTCLEPISALSKRLLVSQVTVRHALLLLAKEGLVDV